MTGQLDQISQAIGGLQASSAEQGRQTDLLWRELSEIKELARKTLAAQERTDTRITSLEKELASHQREITDKIKNEIMPTVQSVKAMKQQGLGALGAVGFVAGILGMKAAELWAWLVAK